MLQHLLQQGLEILDLPDNKGTQGHAHGSADFSVSGRLAQFNKLLGKAEDLVTKQGHRIHVQLFQVNSWDAALNVSKSSLREIGEWAENNESRVQLLRTAAYRIPELQFLDDDKDPNIYLANDDLLVQVSRPPKPLEVRADVSNKSNAILAQLNQESRDLRIALEAKDVEAVRYTLQAMANRSLTLIELDTNQLPQPEFTTHPRWGSMGLELDVFRQQPNLLPVPAVRAWLNFDVVDKQVRFYVAIRPPLPFTIGMARRVTNGDFSSFELDVNEISPLARTLADDKLDSVVTFETEKSGKSIGSYSIDRVDEKAPKVGRMESVNGETLSWQAPAYIEFHSYVNHFLVTCLNYSMNVLDDDNQSKKSERPVLFRTNINTYQRGLSFQIFEGEAQYNAFIDCTRLCIESIDQVKPASGMDTTALRDAATRVLLSTMNVPAVMHLIVMGMKRSCGVVQEHSVKAGRFVEESNPEGVEYLSS